MDLKTLGNAHKIEVCQRFFVFAVEFIRKHTVVFPGGAQIRDDVCQFFSRVSAISFRISMTSVAYVRLVVSISFSSMVLASPSSTIASN